MHFDAIRDSTTNKSYRFGGKADDSCVEVYDYSSSCGIAGEFFGSTYSLHHNGTSAHIELKITDNRFSGYDFGSSSQFNGTVSNGTITIYDFRDGNFYRFSV